MLSWTDIAGNWYIKYFDFADQVGIFNILWANFDTKLLHQLKKHFQ